MGLSHSSGKRKQRERVSVFQPSIMFSISCSLCCFQTVGRDLYQLCSYSEDWGSGGQALRCLRIVRLGFILVLVGLQVEEIYFELLPLPTILLLMMKAVSQGIGKGRPAVRILKGINQLKICLHFVAAFIVKTALVRCF